MKDCVGHALLIVIVEPQTPPDRIEKRIQALMEPYDQDSDAAGRESLELLCDSTEDGNKVADPGCYQCSGSGTITITFNPQEACDWYEPGGRWDGEIRRGGGGRINWSKLIPESIRRNIATVRDVPDGFIPSAVLTPDSVWHGGSGDSDRDLEVWTAEQAEIRRKYADNLAVAIDFHF